MFSRGKILRFKGPCILGEYSTAVIPVHISLYFHFGGQLVGSPGKIDLLPPPPPPSGRLGEHKSIWEMAKILSRNDEKNLLPGMMGFFMNVAIMIGFFIVHGAQAQFPSKCSNIESLRSKTCCPVPEGLNQPCGGPNRGECTEIPIAKWTDRFVHFKESHAIDDRTNWPTLFYNKTCKCKGDFGGYDCSKCKFGKRGVNCTEKKPLLIRKDVRKMTQMEKDNYMSVLNKSRHVTSDYKVATTFHADIMTSNSTNFVEVSAYDFYVWLHYYSARGTFLPNDTVVEDIDFAHQAQGFPTWHRLYLLQWEATLQEIAKDDTFAIPYWDWTNTTSCDICTEDFVGKSDENGNVQGKYFSDKAWHMICLAEMIGLNDDDGLRICDPGKHMEVGLTRRPETDIDLNITTLPTKKEVDFALCFDTFDRDPYNKTSEENFRNTLEGYANTKTGKHSNEDHTLHNQVHIYLGGSLPNKSHEVTKKPGKYYKSGVMKDVPPASNDPIFWLHHSFVDRIFEKWLRRYNKTASEALSKKDAPIGHNSGSPVVPFFPYWFHEDLFKKSSEFGYDYEDVNEKGNKAITQSTVKPLLMCLGPGV